jgi:hypothetical protein
MRFGTLTLAVGAGLIAAAAFAVSPATAAKRHVVVSDTGRPVVTSRARARIIVRRSFLDVGTESMPGDLKYNDYAMPPNYSPTGVIDHTNLGAPSQVMPGPFDLPSKRNPRQF